MNLIIFLLSFDPFYFIHYSDPQIGRNASAQPNLVTAVSQINAMVPPAQFIIVAGDMANNPENQSLVMQQWQICDSLYDLLSMPKYYAPGNNDVGYEDEGCWTPAMLQLYRNFWGVDYYSFDADSCHFVAINSTLLDTYSPHSCYSYSLEQDSFLRWDLQNVPPDAYKHKFLFFHFPLYQSSPNDPNSRSVVDRPRRDTLLQYLHDYNITAVFTGHWHQDYTNFYWPSLLQTGVATCVTGSSAGYRVVKVFENGIETFTILLNNPVDTLLMMNIVNAAVEDDTAYINVPIAFTCNVDTANFPDWNNLSYRWMFGDGDSSISANISHAYADTGHYQVVCAAYRLHDRCAVYRFNIIVINAQSIQETANNQLCDRRVLINAQQHFIEFGIIRSGTVLIELFAVDGRFIDVLYDGYVEKGRHRVSIDNNLGCGVYFVRLKTQDQTSTDKILYIK